MAERALYEVSRRHHGVFTRADLDDTGVSASTTARRVASGAWERRAPGVYALAGTPRTWEHRLMVAIRAAGPDALASHRAAAALHGFPDSRRTILEATTTHGGRREARHGRVHETRHLPPEHRTVVDGIPVTDPLRTLVDLAVVSPPQRVGAALDELRRRRVVRLADVRAVLDEPWMRGRRGAAPLRALVAERTAGDVAGSPLAQSLFDAIVAAGLPRPVVEHRVADGDFVAYLDLAYPDHRLAIEVDSERWHLDLDRFTGDRIRQNRLHLLGWVVLRYPSAVIRHDVGSAVAEIARFLARAA